MEADPARCIVVVNVNGTPVGLVVDTVKEVADIPENQIELPPEVSRNSTQRYIMGLGKMGEAVKILLDVEKLVRYEDMAAMRSVA